MKKAQMGLGMTIVLSLFIFIVFIGVVNLLIPSVTDFRVDMNCANPSEISDGIKVSCLLADTVIIYFIGLVFSVSIGSIVGRFVF